MIEIEKKFLLTSTQQADVLDGAEMLGQKLVTDAYLDTDEYSLTSKDFWFRERDGVYELKAPLQSGGKSGKTNRYNEITDLAEIAQELGLDTTIDFETAVSRAGIKKFITVLTSRTSYEKQGFHIDIDAASYAGSSFEYAVAEIELLVHSEAEGDEAERKIIAFAKSFNLVTDQVVAGKVIAYLKHECPEHYDVLVAAGVINRV